MHILIIPSEIYLPVHSPLSGIFQHHQAHVLRRAGYRVGVLSVEVRPSVLPRGIFGWRKGIRVENDSGIPVVKCSCFYWVRPKSVFVRNGFYWRWAWLSVGEALFRKYMGEFGIPDIIHAHNAICAGMLASRIKQKYGVRYVVTEHSSIYSMGIVPSSLARAVRHCFLEAESQIVVSPSLGELLKEHFGEALHNLRWVPNVLDPIFEEGDFCGEKSGRYVFVHVGSLEPIKGQRYLIEAFAEEFKGRDVELRIGGDGPLRAHLEGIVRALGIEQQVVFLGPLARSDVLREMSHCDAFVLPSAYETFGVVLIEALACGKPVIATRSGGPECIVNSKNGLLVPTRDVRALGRAMREVFENAGSYDRGLIREDCILKFGQKALVSALAEIYHNVERIEWR